MTRRDLLALMGVGAGALTLAGCGEKSSRYRQKITVVVDTPNGVRTGSSVIEVGYAEKPAWAQSFGGNGFWARGEAVAVDLGKGKTLFALLSPPVQRGADLAWYQSRLIMDALRAGAVSDPVIPSKSIDYSVAAHQAIGRSNVELILPISLYPTLVTFRDNLTPASVENIDPNDLSSKLGPDFQLKAITVKVTDEPVSFGIEKKLPWLREHDYGLLNGDRFEDFRKQEFSAHVRRGDFRTERPS